MSGTTFDLVQSLQGSQVVQITIANKSGEQVTPNASVSSLSQLGLPSDANGATAYRIADMMERFGFNLYPMDARGGNAFGAASTCNYTTDGIIHALNWLTADAAGNPGGSGLTTLNRLWTWQAANPPNLDLPGLAATIAQGTGCKFTMTTGGAPNATDSIPWAAQAAIDSMNGVAPWTGAAKGSVIYVEGYNEPNNIGGETGGQTARGQAELYATLSPHASKIGVVGPSEVFGMPFPEGYINGSLGATDVATVSASSTLYNVHCYPPYNPDLDDGSGRGGMFNDIFQGINAAYGTPKPQIITEWHPTLYASETTHKCDPALDAYLAPMFILSAFRLGYLGYVWWSLLDFNDTAAANGGFAGSGLWQHDPSVDAPRPVAYALRAMYALTGDSGAAKRTFTPSKLDYTLTGLPAPKASAPNTGGQSMLFQASSGTFYLFVWNSQAAPGGTAVPVTLTFNSHAMSSVKEYNISNGEASNLRPIQSTTNVGSVTMMLDASVHLFVIHY